MSLSYRQENELHRIEIGLRQSDRQLGAMFSIFGKLYPDQDKPPWEQVPPVSSSRDRLHRAVGWLVAALIATAAAVSALTAAAVAVAAAGWRIRGTGHQARTTRPSRRAAHGRDVE